MYSEDVAELYEMEHRDFDTDIPLYLSYALTTGGPVLELGCGTGRLLAPLLRAGYEVTGVDSSAAMLDRARRKLETVSGFGWQLVQGNLTDLPALPSEGFGMAFCALNTWAHVHDRVGALRALRAIHRALRPAGLLILDLEDPEGRPHGRGELLLAAVFADGDDTITKTVATVYDPSEGADDVTIIWDRTGDGALRRTVVQTRMRPYGRGETEQMLARAGFSVRELLGSWDLETYEGRGDRLIIVASRI